ncbi:hypothetical protein ACE6H2_026063 [Prunus campanulata]
MANDMLKHGDDPPGSTSPLQWLKENEIPVKNDEVANFMGTLNNRNASGVDNITMPCTTTPFSLFPFGDMHGTSNPYAMKMPQTGMNLMADLTPFRNSQNSFFDYDSVYAEGHTPVLPSPVSNFLGLEGNKTEFSKYHTLDYSVPPDNVVSATSDVNIIQKSYVDRKLVTAEGDSTALIFPEMDKQKKDDQGLMDPIQSFQQQISLEESITAEQPLLYCFLAQRSFPSLNVLFFGMGCMKLES